MDEAMATPIAPPRFCAVLRRPEATPAWRPVTPARAPMETGMKANAVPTPAMKNGPGLPSAVDRATFQAELDTLRDREKAHTREGDAIAAARRRLPMVEVDASLAVTGPAGPLTLLDAFEGRRQLIAYYFMWRARHPPPEDVEGGTRG